MKYKSFFVAQIAITIASVVMVYGLFTTHNHLVPYDIFDFRFNPYALISASSAFVCLIFLGTVSRSKVRGAEANWFYTFISFVFLFAIAEMLQRLSANPEAAQFWSRFLGVIVFEIAAGMMFLTNYLYPNVKHIRVGALLFTAATIIFFFFANGSVIFGKEISEFPWGYNDELGDGIVYYLAWTVTVSLSVFLLLGNYIRTTKNKILRKQAMLFMLAFSYPFIAGFMTEAIIPLLNGGEATVVPLDAAAGALTAGTMLLGLKKYRVFQVSPAMLSEEILALMSESVIVVDRDLKIQFVNQETKEAFSKAGGKLEGTYVTEFLDEQSRKRLVDRLRHLKVGETAFLDDIVLEIQDENRIFGRLAISRTTEENGFDGFVIVISDVTELKQSYEALEHEKANVEHTVEVRTQELREAQQRLLETDKMKTEFVILTSHHLRTPLTIIKGKLELLNMPTLKEDDKHKFLEDAQASAQKLGELVEDLLTISTIEAGNSLVLEKVPAREILDPLVAEAQHMMTANGNTLQTHINVDGAMIHANANRLRGGIRNILDNAFKFTKNGTVVFEAGSDKENLWITIRDNGVGIAANEIPNLFTKFHRGTDVMKYEYDGEGIGLYLAKLILDDHNGKIDINSREGVGTGVKITIPLADQPKVLDTATQGER